MKKIYYLLSVLLLVLLFSSNTIAQTAVASDGSGADFWTDLDAWVDEEIPTCAAYSAITIPDGVILIIKESVTLDCAIDFTIEDGGTLRLKSIGNDPTVLTLGAGSTVTVEVGGTIDTDHSSSENRALNELIINSIPEWKGDDGIVNGYKKFPETLPIELLSFTAEASDQYVEIIWSTSSEINNDFFTIERSSNGIDFEIVAMTAGAGNSSEIQEYSIMDDSPITGVSYYRLKQTDYDGKYEYFDLIGVSVEKDDNNDCIVTVYPNPCLGRCTVSMSKCKDNLNGATKVSIMDISGHMITSDVPDVRSDGSFSYSINSQNNFAPGIYLIKAGGNKSNKTKQVIMK